MHVMLLISVGIVAVAAAVPAAPLTLRPAALSIRSRTAGSGSIPPRRPRPSSDCLALIGIDTREAAWKKAQAAKPRQWLEFFSFASDNGKINLDWE